MGEGSRMRRDWELELDHSDIACVEGNYGEGSEENCRSIKGDER